MIAKLLLWVAVIGGQDFYYRDQVIVVQARKNTIVDILVREIGGHHQRKPVCVAVIDDLEDPPAIMGIITSADIMQAYNRKLAEIKLGSEKPVGLPNDQLVLEKMNLKKILEKDILTIAPESTLGELVKLIIKSKRNIFPVVDNKRNYYGIILLNDVRELMFDQRKYNRLHAKDIMRNTETLIRSNETMNKVVEKFDRTRDWNLPVVDKNNHYLGIISQSTLFKAYRNQLVYHTEL